MKVFFRFLVILSLGNFAYYLLASNLFDWEQFYTFIEADRRSWINDLELPIWSYQLCAGITRIGDPQSFGLSPIFIFPLLFGTLYGAKVMVLFATFVGYHYIKKLFLLIAGPVKSDNHLLLYQILPLFYILSGGFLGHFHVGHLTYINFHFFAIVTYIVFKIILQSKLTPTDYLAGFLAIFTIFMGGFYHSFVFWGIPLAFCSTLYLTYLAITSRQLFLTQSKLFFRSLILPFLLSSYKFIQVIIYQLTFPRELSNSSTAEFNTLWQLFKNHFIPVSDFKSYWFGLAQDQKWGIFEDTAFSFWPILIVISLTLYFKNKNVCEKINPQLKVFLALLFIIFFSLSLGNFADYSPFNLLNTYLLSDSLRVAVRYNLGVCFVLFCILAVSFTKSKITKWNLGLVTLLLIPLNIYIYLPFFTYNIEQIRTLENNPIVLAPKMDTVAFAPAGNLFTSNNYIYLRQGLAILNCYNPITRGIVASESLQNSNIEQLTKYPLIHGANEFPNENCVRNSYFTQNKLVLSQDCQGRVCFNLNAINPADWGNNFYYDPDVKKYCQKN